MPQEEVAGRQHGQFAPQHSPDVSPADQDGGVWTPGHGRPTRESQEAFWAGIRDAAAGLAGVAGLHGHDDADLQQGTARLEPTKLWQLSEDVILLLSDLEGSEMHNGPAPPSHMERQTQGQLRVFS